MTGKFKAEDPVLDAMDFNIPCHLCAEGDLLELTILAYWIRLEKRPDTN